MWLITLTFQPTLNAQIKDEAMPLEQHLPAFRDLALHLQTLAPMRLIFVPSPGNWGDSLINAGTREFLAAYSFEYTELIRNDVIQLTELANCHLVVGGGGGWCRFWHSTPEFVDQVLPSCGHVTILPTSIADAPIIPHTGNNLTIYSRGTTGLEDSNLNIRYCHDMAFHCSDAAAVAVSAKGTESLNAFREDKESALVRVPERNYDVSLQGDGFTDTRPLYHQLAQFSVIRTDRLHLAIAAAQLGIRVDLYPSGYAKIEGVYFQSMKDHFPSVIPHFDQNSTS